MGISCALKRRCLIALSLVQDRWGEEALKWAVECSSRHLSGRSLQVFRALSLPLSSHGAACMLYCLHMVLKRAASNSEDVTALNCAMEILLSLQVKPCACFPSCQLVRYALGCVGYDCDCQHRARVVAGMRLTCRVGRQDRSIAWHNIVKCHSWLLTRSHYKKPGLHEILTRQGWRVFWVWYRRTHDACMYARMYVWHAPFIGGAVGNGSCI